MIISRICEKTGRTEIGLQLVTFSTSPDLNKGVTLVIFNILGKVPN